jgi:hypothetical protein
VRREWKLGFSTYLGAFIPSRNILEGVVILRETIHELHRKKMDGALFKIDFEKA